MREQNALLRVRGLRKHFPITRGFFQYGCRSGQSRRWREF